MNHQFSRRDFLKGVSVGAGAGFCPLVPFPLPFPWQRPLRARPNRFAKSRRHRHVQPQPQHLSPRRLLSVRISTSTAGTATSEGMVIRGARRESKPSRLSMVTVKIPSL